MKRSIKNTVMVIILVTSILLGSVSVFADSPVPLSLTTVTGTVGSTVTMFFTMGENSGLGAGSFTITYDSSKLEAQSTGALEPLTTQDSIIYKQSQLIDENENPIGGSSTFVGNVIAPGTIKASVINTVGFVTGGNLFRLRFKLLAGAEGAMPVNVAITEFKAATSGNPNIPYTITSQGIVNGPAVATPTSSNTPTPIPTPVPAAVSLASVAGNKFSVSIAGCKPTYSYQIWAYQTMTSDIFDGNTFNSNNWKLVAPYTLGSALNIDSNQTGSTEIDSFSSIENNYTIAVRVVDQDGNYVEQLKDSFTAANIGITKITKVLVDGKMSFDTTEVKEIKAGATVQLTVLANITEGTTYTATSKPSSSFVQNGNVFTWDISGMDPGKYVVTLGANTDKVNVNFELYKAGTASEYGQISNLTLQPPTVIGESIKYDFTPVIPVFAGKKFQYSIGEQGRRALYTSDSMDATLATAGLSDQTIGVGDYGIYLLSNIIKKANGTVEDGIVKQIVNKRPGADSTMSLTATGLLTKGNPVSINASASIPNVAANQVEYAFYRLDAKGSVMVRDYSLDGELGWTPSRVGDYTIQVRAKGPGAKSYEVLKAIDITITDTTDFKAIVTNVTINNITGAMARTPIEIIATAASTESDLLYKYIIADNYIYYAETSYSVNSHYMWIPGKAGNYSVQVLVKNSKSFGKYDYIKTFNVTVN